MLAAGERRRDALQGRGGCGSFGDRDDEGAVRVGTQPDEVAAVGRDEVVEAVERPVSTIVIGPEAEPGYYDLVTSVIGDGNTATCGGSIVRVEPRT